MLTAALDSVQGMLSRIALPRTAPAAALRTPVPRTKPERDILDAFLPDDSIGRISPDTSEETSEIAAAKGPKSLIPKGYESVAQCGPATIIARESTGSAPRIYKASFAADMIDGFADRGCTLIQKGCNTCTVSYTGCSEAERKACTDAACLAEKCERKVVCSSKMCTAEGANPSCKWRIAQVSCLRSAFGNKAPDRPVTASKRQ